MQILKDYNNIAKWFERVSIPNSTDSTFHCVVSSILRHYSYSFQRAPTSRNIDATTQIYQIGSARVVIDLLEASVSGNR